MAGALSARRRGGALSGGRGTTVRVKSASRRRPSSTRWLERQLNDPFVAEARRRGYRSRAAFKLMQLDDRFHLLRPGKRVVDLGCAPGGWTQVAVERVKPRPGQGAVIGIDILAMDPVPGAAIVTLDFLDPEAAARLESLLAGLADVVLSDMAAPKRDFSSVRHAKPPASRAESAEMYVVATGFRGKAVSS